MAHGSLISLEAAARPGRAVSYVAKNLLRWKVRKCVILPPKTSSVELAVRRLRLRLAGASMVALASDGS